MIQRKLILVLAFIVFSLFLLNSCNKEDAPLEAYGDVLIKSIRSGDSIIYGVYYYAYSWDKMANASVSREGTGTTTTLDSIEGRYTYIHVPDSMEFKTSKPMRARYIFNVDFDNGEQYETSDILDSTSLKPVVIKEFKFDKEDEKIIIDWESNLLADQYIVVLERDDKQTVFQSDVISVNHTELWISLYTTGWISDMQPKGGEKYKVKILAYQFEPVPSTWDLQSVSVAESSFVEWIIN